MTRSRAIRFSIVILVLAFIAGVAQAQIGAVVSNWAVPSSGSSSSSGLHHSQALGDVTNAVPFIGVTPCRIVDTRGPAGPYGAPSLVAGSPRNFALLGGPCTGIPAAASAYSLNITVTNTLGAGFIKLYPQGGAAPVVSTINYVAGQTIANAAIVPAGTGGGITAVAGVSGTDLLIDINGYFPTGNGSLLLNPGQHFDVSGNTDPLFGMITTRNDSATDGAMGVLGIEGGATGRVYGIYGREETSGAAGAAGVAGESGGGAPNANFTTFLSTGGIGLLGLNTGNYGVVGVSNFISGKFINENVSGTELTVAYLAESGDAARFFGNVQVNNLGAQAGNLAVVGTVSKGGGSFKIDHPLDPANKYLYHSFVESPDMMNVYNGNVVLDSNGQAVVVLPDYFEALNMDFRYQLTSIGRFSPVYVADEIQDNQFRIAGGRAGAKVSWQVTGIRHDRFANANRIQVEVEKEEAAKGFYLHPDVWGKGPEMSLTKRVHQATLEREDKQVDDKNQ